MSSLRIIALAAVAASALTLQPARAADMPIPHMPPPPIEEFGGWYLRGHIGMSNQGLKALDNISFATAPGFTWLDRGAFDSAPIFGVGIGYQYNSWLRFDLTGEWRGGASFKALDQYTDVANCPPPNNFCTNDYSAIKKEWLFLANAYLDLGTWWSISPYIGAGLGFANVHVGNFRDVNVLVGGGGWAPGASKWNFAWALHAGLSYKVTPTFMVDLGYRFVSLGNGITGDLLNMDGTNPTPNNPMHFKGLYSHDLMLGVRWLFDEPFAPPPLIRKG
jgi:opacity protein-like surface antigen